MTRHVAGLRADAPGRALVNAFRRRLDSTRTINTSRVDVDMRHGADTPGVTTAAERGAWVPTTPAPCSPWRPRTDGGPRRG